MKNITSVLALIAATLFAGCSSVGNRPIVEKLVCGETTLAGVHYPATYCLIVRNPGRSGDDQFDRVEVSRKQYEAATVAKN